jgi:hypothetical protein
VRDLAARHRPPTRPLRRRYSRVSRRTGGTSAREPVDEAQSCPGDPSRRTSRRLSHRRTARTTRLRVGTSAAGRTGARRRLRRTVDRTRNATSSALQHSRSLITNQTWVVLCTASASMESDP